MELKHKYLYSKIFQNVRTWLLNLVWIKKIGTISKIGINRIRNFECHWCFARKGLKSGGQPSNKRLFDGSDIAFRYAKI